MKHLPRILPDTGWRPAPITLSLENDEVHVWQANLDRNQSEVDDFLCMLSIDERARADRFHFPKDRDHFIIARGVLRNILGLYLNRDPASLSFQYSSHGKPFLAPVTLPDAISFNLSHSNGTALYAMTRSREVGVDVEFIRTGPQGDQIAERFFSPQEVAALHALPPASQRYAFFLCWTRKEAYIKARGEGLSMPLDRFDVSLVPGEPAELLATRPDVLEADRWSLRNLTIEEPGYAAAVAVEGIGWSLELWRWNPQDRTS
jgi:4'-phosphopantetheinyl transferase